MATSMQALASATSHFSVVSDLADSILCSTSQPCIQRGESPTTLDHSDLLQQSVLKHKSATIADYLQNLLQMQRSIDELEGSAVRDANHCVLHPGADSLVRLTTSASFFKIKQNMF